MAGYQILRAARTQLLQMETYGRPHSTRQSSGLTKGVVIVAKRDDVVYNGVVGVAASIGYFSKLIALDDAHCIPPWAEFREAYAFIGR